MTEPSKGYFSVIQCCPDFARMESVNVGVVLFVPGCGFLDARITKNSRRARKLFPPDVISWHDFIAQLRNLASRIQREGESGSFSGIESFQEFTAKRANGLLLTPPRPMRVADPAVDLAALFRDLVEVEQPAIHRGHFERRVRERLQPLADCGKLKFDVKVDVPVIGGEKRFDAGLQNGSFHLIEAVTFDVDERRRNVPKACTYAVEGRALSTHRSRFGDTKLIVIGSFEEDDSSSRSQVESIFREYQVRLLTEDDLGELVHEIESQGKILTDSRFAS